MVPDIGGRNPKNVAKGIKFLTERIKTLKDTDLAMVGDPSRTQHELAENKLLIIALEFRLALVQQKLMAHPHPVGGIALRQHKNGRIVPFDGAIKPLLESPSIVPTTGIGAGGGALGNQQDKSNKK